MWPVDQLYSERTPWKQQDLLIKINLDMVGLILSMVKPILSMVKPGTHIFKWMKKILVDGFNTFV